MENHKEMFQVCIKKIPSLKKVACPIVTDKEKGIVNAVQQELSSLTLLFCWNHIIRDIRAWCRSHGAHVAVYTEDVRQLLHSETKEDYDVKLEKFREE